jgi:mRNA-decapping enzyme 1B
MATNKANLAEARRTTNLRVLHRLDPQIVDLAITATHVVLYEFNLSTQQWIKKNVEGSLFVVNRSDVPRFKLIISNRNSTENLEVGITSTFQMQLREPYLIFRDSSSSSSGGGGGTDEAIRGLWFHDGKEREQLHSYLENVVKSLQKIEEMERLHGPPPALLNNNKKNNSSNNDNNKGPVVEVNTNAAGAALLSALHLNDNTTTAAAAAESKSRKQSPPLQTTGQSNNTTKLSSSSETSSSSPSPPPQSKTPTTLDKKSLQLALLSLIQDERFLDLIHAQYLKVASSRARREQEQQQQNNNQQQQGQGENNN